MSWQTTSYGILKGFKKIKRCLHVLFSSSSFLTFSYSWSIFKVSVVDAFFVANTILFLPMKGKLQSLWYLTSAACESEAARVWLKRNLIFSAQSSLRESQTFIEESFNAVKDFSKSYSCWYNYLIHVIIRSRKIKVT